jgi:ketosteroid isomerase-like protein
MNARSLWLIAPFLVSLACLSTLLPAYGDGQSAESQQIRDTRERFNLAIERQDAEAIGGLLAPSYHIVTGRSELAHSRDEAVENWRSTFRNDPTFVCRRAPDDITVNAAWGLAQEVGHWSCKYHVGSEPVHYIGVYAAKWQRAVDATWLLQSEVFTTLSCEGPDAGCRPPDPLE